MFCLECNVKLVSEKHKRYHYTECGLSHVYLKNVTTLICPNCNYQEVEIPDPAGLQAEIARRLVSKLSRLNGREFRFLRTFLGHSGADIARLFDVTRETVSRWETGAIKIQGPADIALRYMVLTGKANHDYKVTDLNDILKSRQRIKTLQGKFNNIWQVTCESA
jgi:putative zinc finger/helix-turn-helix YgiT family protein